jgi:phage terminase large subunit
MVEDCLAEPGNSGGEGMRAVCIREIQKDLAQSAKLLLETKIASLGLTESDGFKVYEDCIATPGDGIVVFKGMNNYTSDSIKSLEGFKRAWWEEAHTATQKSINLLRPTMRASGSQLWWSYNPRLRADPVDVMFRGAEKPTGSIIIEANWRDNPWFTAELEQERLDCLRMQPAQYEHIWEGDYVTANAGAYYAASLTQARAEGRITDDVAPDPIMRFLAIWDIGVRDACAIWIAQIVGTSIRVLNYYEAVGQPLAAHLNWLRENGYGKAACVLPHDGAKHDAVTAIRFEDHVRAAGFEVITIQNQGKGAALKRVEASRRIFPSIRFHKTKCSAGLAALGWYHEKIDETRNIGLGPDHDWSSHGADAFGLLCVAYEEPNDREQDDEREPVGRSATTGY